ncbi:Ig-like domain-containing protein [Galbitalea sp. SE-J8]|uniref:Ig-like domain-containing protein n=1 Tax=Galbitalea sp. SE-J8 TaxID=3054952 RepID=UPI00259C8941|nr:Ig-like domain-containing protein [Galbitalea sp. SE-J8]MDM4764244.1 Ig-like domain-containing protein [Galbitalea sp. SE-J8]
MRQNRFLRLLAAVTVGALAVGGLTTLAVTPAYASDTITLGTSDSGVSYQLIPDADTYSLAVVRDGAVQWATTAGAVGVRYQSTSAPSYSAYLDVAKVSGAWTASADVVVGNNTVVHVTDTFHFAHDTLDIARHFEVTSLGAGDSGKGIYVTFPIRTGASANPSSFKWFSPGTWYGNDALTFAARNKMAFDGTETSLPTDGMPAPLITAYDPATGYGLTLLDRTPGDGETIAADKDPQTNKTLVDSRFNVAGLGLRQVTADGGFPELFQSYPGYNRNYRNIYSGKPSIMRYLPLSDTLSRDTGMALRYDSYADFSSAVDGVWRAAYADTAEVVDRVDTKIHFDTLVDYVDNSYGTSGGKRVYSTNYALLQTSSGFLWRQADMAWVELAQGWARGNEGMKTRARNVINDQVNIGGIEASTNPRTRGEAYTALMEAYREDLSHGVDNVAWLNKAKAYADALSSTASGPDHSLGAGALTIWAVPALLLLADTTGDAGYAAKARAAGDAAWAVQSQDMNYSNSLEDYNGQPAERDREAGYTSLEAYMYLYRSATDPVEKAKWLDHAKYTADYAETWNFIHSVLASPVDGTDDLIMYDNEHVPSYGLSGIHAGAAGGDIAQALYSSDFYELGQATGDQHYIDFARYIEKNSMLYTNMGDKAGQMSDVGKGSGLGFTNEYLGTSANDYWNNDQRGDGNASNIGWATFVLLGMTQKTLDATGDYTVAAPTVSDINGLNNYYRIVNKATGEALDVAGQSRANDAALTTTPVNTSPVRTQQWLLQPMTGGGFKIVDRATAKVVNVAGKATNNGANVVQSVYYKRLASTFAFAQDDDGYFTITNTNSNKALEINTGSGTTVGVQQNTANGSDYQKWSLVPVGDLQILDRATSIALASGTHSATTGTVVRTAFDDDATKDQRWVARPSLDGYVGLVSHSGGLVLTQSGDGVALTPASKKYTTEFASNQQWKLVLSPDGYFSLVSRNGKALARSGSGSVSLATADGSDGQLFRVLTAGPATVAKPATVVAATPVTRSISVGQELALPATVSVTLSDESTDTRAVTWATPSSAQLSTPGTFDLAGTIEGTTVPAKVRVAVTPADPVVSIDPVDTTTVVGVAPTLPTTVSATAESGPVTLPVTWAAIDPESYSAEGTFTVSGTVPGTEIAATATVHVTAVTITAVANARVITQRQVAPALPPTVVATRSDGTTAAMAVTWNAVSAAQYQNAGYFQVQGAVDGWDSPVVAYVTVAYVYDDFATDATSRWTSGGNKTWAYSNNSWTIPQNAGGTSSYSYVKDPLNPANPLSLSNFVVEADVSVAASTGNAGLWFRSGSAANDQNAYYLGIEGNTTYYAAGIQKANAWTAWSYANADTPANGTFYKLRAIADGTTISYYAKDMVTPKWTQTDSSFASGYIGARTYVSAAAFKNFVIKAVPATIAVTGTNTVQTTAGVAPALPALIPGQDESGELRKVPVTWNAVDPSAYASPGTFTVHGTAGSVPASVTVTVLPALQVTRFATSLVLTKVATQPSLPGTVSATLSDGTTVSKPVVWDTITPAQLASSGYFSVSGTVTGTSLHPSIAVGVAEYSDSFASTGTTGWDGYPSSGWSISSGRLVSATANNGAGEKAVSRYVPSSGDVVYQATVRTTSGSTQQAGLILRVSSPANGADNYTGYYVGVNTTAKTAVLGRANGSWTQLVQSGTISSLATGTDAAIRVIARGQRFLVYVNDMSTPVIDYTDTSSTAPVSGQFGSRGYNTSYQYGNVLLLAAPPVDTITPITGSVPEGVAPSLPATVAVNYLGGSTATRPVTWDVDGADLTADPIVITGTVAGTTVPATATFTVIPAVLSSTVTTTVTTDARTAPELPEKVTGRYSNGTTQLVDAVWDAVDPGDYATGGSFIATGHVDGDASVATHAIVSVTPIIDAFDAVPIAVQVGTAPVLPETVVARYTDDSWAVLPVTWDAVDPASYASTGTFEVQGRVEGTSVRAIATVTVSALPVVAVSGSVSITGTPVVGSTLGISDATWTPSSAVRSYQWNANGTAIPGATAATYLVDDSVAGESLTVTVTGSAPGYTPNSITSAPSAAVLRTMSGTPVPTVSGTLVVGATVAADPGEWLPSGVTLGYQWLADGAEIPGATASSLVLPATVAGAHLSVTVTGTKDGYVPVSRTSAQTDAVQSPTVDVVLKKLQSTPKPKITGAAQVGRKLTAKAGAWAPSGVTLTYQWRVNGAAIAKATAPTLVIPASAAGKRITVTVTGTKSGYLPVSVTSAKTGPVLKKLHSTPKPKVTGQARVGHKLAAKPGKWTPARVKLTYRWKANGVAIARATRSTLVIPASLAGKRITVTVTGSKAGYAAVSVTSTTKVVKKGR